MKTTVKITKQKELLFNPGEIVEIEGWPRWRTHVGPFALELDIVEPGIASFVVMEQEQPFLDFVAGLLAEAIAEETKKNKVLLITVESKGSHLAPRIWDHLVSRIGDKLSPRAVTLRKGEPKVYMQRPLVINGQRVVKTEIPYYSITSKEKQILRVSPLDLELLSRVENEKATLVYVDDFIGRGGTVVAVHHLFQQLKLQPPRLVAVVGADGRLYEETFAKENIDIQLLPSEFPLKLPTFARPNPQNFWHINI